MLTIRAYWAGRLIFQEEVEKNKLVGRVQEIEDEVKGSRLTYSCVGHTFTVEEICLDVYKNNKLDQIFQFKK